MTRYLVAGALLAGLAIGQRSDSLEVELQAAIQKEATEGNLRAAMEQYRKIAARAGANRAVAARALVRLGVCQRKLGDQDARRTWERVVKEYGDQAAAAEARTLLASLGGAKTAGLTVRKVWTNTNAEDPRFLPDGTTFVFSDDTVAEIKTFDVTTRQVRQISKFGGFAVTYPTTPIPSPDGRWIAVSQLLNFGHRYEVWLLRSDGSQTRTLLKLSEQERIHLLDWSPDGKFLYARRGPYQRGRPSSREMDCGLIAVADGAWTTLKKEASRQVGARFSKDGRWIAYSTEEQTRLMAVDGSRDTALGAYPLKMRLVDWSPEGRWLIVTGDRSGAPSLWRVPVNNGVASGEPELLRADLGSQRPLAMAPDGALLCQDWETRSEAWITSLDVAQGKLGASRTRVTENPAGLTMFAGWSPDGSRVAAIGLSVKAEGRLWVVRPSAGGVEQRLELRSPVGHRLRPVWSRDGQKVFVMTPGGREAKHAILELATGTVKELDLPEGVSLFATPTPDGRFYSSAGNMQPAGPRILVYDPVSKSEREVYADPGAWIIRGLVPSPDGKRLAFAGTAAGSVKDGQRVPGKRFLRVLDLGAGKAITIAEAHVSWYGPQRQSIAWTPDGAHLLYSTEEFAEGSDRVKTRIWIAPSAGGPSRLMEELDGRTFDHTVSPDGRQFGFTHLTQTADFWLMENVLPQ